MRKLGKIWRSFHRETPLHPFACRCCGWALSCRGEVMRQRRYPMHRPWWHLGRWKTLESVSMEMVTTGTLFPGCLNRPR